jgi:hypothetical protein
MAHPGGRPSKISPERRKDILAMITSYVPYEIAAVANGICERTFYDWLKRGAEDLSNSIESEYAEFLQSIKRAEANRIVENAGVLHDREDGWQSKAWLLERRHWKHFSNNAPLVELNKRLDELEAMNKDKEQ